MDSVDSALRDGYYSHMKKPVGTAELKNNLSAYLKLVRRGASYVVTDRGEPVAELGPIKSKTETSLDEKLQHLEDQGMLTRASRSGPLKRFKPIKLKGKKLASQMLIEDREERATGLLSR